MKICYIILSCDKYIPTRGEWVRKSWLKHVRPEDSYFFLSSTPNLDQNIVGWNTPDDYKSAPYKYYAWFANMTVEADWYIFVDDDTFVFPRKLESFLSQFDPKTELYIGKMSMVPSLPKYMSGGAGFVVSKPLYLRVQEYIKVHRPELRSINTDVTFGHWLEDIGHTSYLWDTRFHSHPHKHTSEIQSAITFHYVTEPLLKTYTAYL